MTYSYSTYAILIQLPCNTNLINNPCRPQAPHNVEHNAETHSMHLFSIHRRSSPQHQPHGSKGTQSKAIGPGACKLLTHSLRNKRSNEGKERRKMKKTREEKMKERREEKGRKEKRKDNEERKK